MSFSYQCWGDFGPAGVPPGEVAWAYDPDASYGFPGEDAAVIADAWASLVESTDGLHDAPGLNLRTVDGTRIRVGPTRFRDHYLRRLALSGIPRFEADNLSTAGKQQLVDSVRLLSSFVAVVADDTVVLGVKPPRADRGALLSFPGSGYLDRTHDVQDGVAPTRSIVGRELGEELGVTPDSDQIHCLGVFGDTDPVSHLNPALFSVVTLEASPDSLRETARRAPDIDEFSELVFAPLTEDVLDALVELGVEGTASSIPEGVPVGRFEGMSHKSLLMLLLLGRRDAGVDWFDRTLAAYPEISIEPA